MRPGPLTRRLLFALAALGIVATVASAEGLSEYEVKAAFVYNFAKFTEWPAEVWARPGALRVCVAGPSNEFATALDGLGDKPAIQGKAVQVVRINAGAEVSGCHVLVLTARERIARDWLQRASGGPVLTVGDADGFAQAGGVVGLTLDGERVRFDINVDTVQQARLRLSSNLLKLARIVKGGA
jgi:hypothetical protein